MKKTSSMISKEEYYKFFIEKGSKSPILDAKGIKKFDPELHDKVYEFETLYYSGENMRFSELLLCYLKDIIKHPICFNCGLNEPIFKQFHSGYRTYCSVKCSSNSTEKKTSIEDTNLEKYGHKNAAHGLGVQERILETNLERYGAIHPSQSDIVKERIKETNIEKYGVEWTFQSELVKDKIKETNLERYGFESAMQNDIVKNKVTQTSKENGHIYKWDDEELKDLETYRKKARYYTDITYKEHFEYINPNNLTRGRYDYDLDHIYPLIEGWKNGIDAKDIAHKDNLQMLGYIENRQKGNRNYMTKEEFYIRIKK